MKIFLDDVRNPIECVAYMHHRIGPLNPIYLEEWVIVRTYKTFCEIIKANLYKITHVSFDHDLTDCFQLKESIDIDTWYDTNGNREYTGTDCCKFFIALHMEHHKKLPITFVHSMNPVGTKRISDLLDEWRKLEK